MEEKNDSVFHDLSSRSIIDHPRRIARDDRFSFKPFCLLFIPSPERDAGPPLFVIPSRKAPAIPTISETRSTLRTSGSVVNGGREEETVIFQYYRDRSSGNKGDNATQKMSLNEPRGLIRRVAGGLSTLGEKGEREDRKMMMHVASYLDPSFTQRYRPHREIYSFASH